MSRIKASANVTSAEVCLLADSMQVPPENHYLLGR